MSVLLSVLTLIATPTAHASQSVELNMSLKSTALYEATSASAYRMKSGMASVSIHIEADANGLKQAQDTPTTSSAESDGAIDVLSKNSIRYTSGGSSLELQAIISPDGSIRVKGSEMKRGVQRLMQDKLVALQNQLAGKGAVSVSINASDLVCRAKTRALHCESAATIRIGAVSQ